MKSKALAALLVIMVMMSLSACKGKTKELHEDPDLSQYKTE